MAKDVKFTVGNQPITMYAQELEGLQPGGTGAIILLHGAGGHHDFWTGRFGPLLEQAGIALYAPHYFESTQTTRADFAAITDGVHVPKWLDTIRAAVAYVATRPNIDPERIVLAGISLGAFLSLALAAELSSSRVSAERATVRAVLDISGGLVAPYDKLATPQFPPTLILHGAEDTIVPASHAHELDRKLTQLDVAHRTEILPGEGHWFSAASVPRILLATSAFLREHMQVKPIASAAM